MCNKKESFSLLCPKSYNFITANRDIIRLEEVDTIKLTLLNELDMTLSNIAFAPRCYINLIFLSQLREVAILYHDHSESMILIKARITISVI